MARAPLDTAARYLPPDPGKLSLATLRRRAAGCEACPLFRTGTQTVFGDGPPTAQIVFVGEQPGDREDRAGQPFVGPAGQLFDRALAEAGIERDRAYVTNAVKHFKWVPQGKRRLHQKPNAREIAACRPWLEAELAVIRPKLVVALGATAAQTLMGSAFRVTRERGRILSAPFAPAFLATIHPSAILRGPPADRDEAFAALVADLKVAAKHLAH
ncbi:MAG: UdgX family uracil-DNA binding protein [Opitutus sp.]|nr:UdgX family uracil-DNA binding protein [Opitutus sp.]